MEQRYYKAVTENNETVIGQLLLDDNRNEYYIVSRCHNQSDGWNMVTDKVNAASIQESTRMEDSNGETLYEGDKVTVVINGETIFGKIYFFEGMTKIQLEKPVTMPTLMGKMTLDNLALNRHTVVCHHIAVRKEEDK